MMGVDEELADDRGDIVILASLDEYVVESMLIVPEDEDDDEEGHDDDDI